MQDSDYENPDEHSDSEMYVMPAEENGDDSYEPPPAEQDTRTVHPALPFTRGEYVGEATHRPWAFGLSCWLDRVGCKHRWWALPTCQQVIWGPTHS